MKYILLLVIVCLFGCRSKKEIDWAFECSQKFPTKTVYLQGKDTTVWDTIIEPGLIIQADPILIPRKCPDSYIIKGRTVRVDTFKTPDVARETFLLNQFNASIKTNTELLTLNRKIVAEAEKSEQNASKSRQQRNLLGIGIILSGLWSLRKIISKIISPLL